MSRVQEAVERVLRLSRADGCVVLGVESSSANVRWANNTSTTNGVTRDAQLFVVSIIGRRVGTVGATYFPDERLESIVRASEAACEDKPDAEDFMELLAGGEPPDDWADAAPSTGVEVFAGLVPPLAGILRRAEADDVLLFGFAEHTTSTSHLATSTGRRARHTQSEAKVEINAKSRDFARSAWAGQAAPTLDGVDVAALYERLGRRLAWSTTTVELPAGRYEVLLEPSAVADMLLYAYWSSSAREADEGRSVFSRAGGGNRIGERLYPESVNIYSDPHEPGFEVTPFVASVASSSYSSLFDSGLPTARTDWVRDGTLEALITTRHWAARSGSDRVTPYVDNLVFPAEGPGLDEMIASTKRALLVTCFWYMRAVDPQTLLLTGLTRDGVFLVEDGEVKGAVNNFRFNMSPVDMLARITEIGQSQATLPREFGDNLSFVKVPPLRVDDFNLSSVSQAT